MLDVLNCTQRIDQEMTSNSKRRWIPLTESGIDARIVTRDLHVFASTSKTRSAPCKDGQTGSSVFTDDILPVILDNLDVLTSKDLLLFRLVNKSWRTAATSVLLKRNACQIVLQIGQVPLSADVNLIHSHSQLLKVSPNESYSVRVPPIFKYYSAKPPHSLLPELINLITTSPQFPSSSIKFLEGCEKALKNLPLALPKENYLLEKDELMRLFSLWGKDIKALAIGNRIPSSSVEKLLFLHTPNLLSLDFANCIKFDITDPEQKQNQVFHVTGKRRRNPNLNLTLKKLEKINSGAESAFHWTKAEFLKQLVRVSPNIRVVQEVGLAGLWVLVKMGNAHLIKSLCYNQTVSEQFTSLIEEVRRLGRTANIPFLQPSQLTVKLSRVSRKSDEYRDVTRVLNLILRGSKDTLEYLELHVNPQDFFENIQIPPLGKLKCLKLVRENESFGNPLQSRNSDKKMEKRQDGEANMEHRDPWVYDRHVFEFENEQNPHRLPRNYFPQLSSVMLDVDPGSMNTCNKILALFALEHSGGQDKSVVSGDVVSSVTHLELSAFPDVDQKLGGLFPSVRHLKIKCGPGRKLYNWVWAAFPALERFEIYDFIPGLDTRDVDSFFTGIPPEIFTEFPCYVESGTIPELSPEQIKLYRRQPYIGDCGNLKELTIQFQKKISKLFATKMSSLHGLQQVFQQTRILFSFESLALPQQEMEETRKHLEPLSPCVIIGQ